MSDYYTNTTEISEEALGGIFAALAGVFLFNINWINILDN